MAFTLRYEATGFEQGAVDMIWLAFWKILSGCRVENRLLRIGQKRGDQLLGSCGNPGEREVMVLDQLL